MFGTVPCRWQALALAGLILGGCERAGDEPAGNAGVAAKAAPEPVVPAADMRVDRRALLLAVTEAASAAGLGQDDTAEQRALDGKPFEVRIRFGCAPGAGPRQSPAGPFRIRFEPASRTLRISATPDLRLDARSIAAAAGEGIEAVEGFWMYRPWLLTDGCPRTAPQSVPAAGPGGEASDGPAAADPAAGAGPAHRVGLAHFFTEADSRTRRRHERPYELTKVLADDEEPSAQGYNLVLSGRLRRLPSGRVISCRPSAAGPPECVVSAQFDRVWIEHPGNRSVVSEWAS